MSESNDLHGNAPDQSEVAVLLIDVINDLEFEGGEKLLEAALPAAEKISRLKKSARDAGVPVIYVNDNFGRWRSDFKKLVDHCLKENVRGREIAELLVPDEDDYFVLKPKHSGFFSTTLDLLLEYLGVRHLVITGFAGNNASFSLLTMRTCVIIKCTSQLTARLHLNSRTTTMHCDKCKKY